MILRRAKIEEAELLTDIFLRAFHSDFPLFGEENDGPPDFDSPERHRKMQQEGHLYSYLNTENRIIGGAVLFADNKKVYMGRIFIAPEYHRKGYGMSLMRDIEKLFPEAEVFEPDTPLTNRRTNALYKKPGYEETGRNEDTVFYGKRIKKD